MALADCALYNGDLVSCRNQISRYIAMKLMHILVHVLPKTRFIDLEYFVLTLIFTCTIENFNCIFRNNKSESYLVLAWNPSFVTKSEAGTLVTDMLCLKCRLSQPSTRLVNCNDREKGILPTINFRNKSLKCHDILKNCSHF